MRAKALGRAALRDVAGIVTPDTLLRAFSSPRPQTTGAPSSAESVSAERSTSTTDRPGDCSLRVGRLLAHYGRGLGSEGIDRAAASCAALRHRVGIVALRSRDKSVAAALSCALRFRPSLLFRPCGEDAKTKV
jgi:hypothetical protein